MHPYQPPPVKDRSQDESHPPLLGQRKCLLLGVPDNEIVAKSDEKGIHFYRA